MSVHRGTDRIKCGGIGTLEIQRRSGSGNGGICCSVSLLKDHRHGLSVFCSGRHKQAALVKIGLIIRATIGRRARDAGRAVVFILGFEVVVVPPPMSLAKLIDQRP
jgi:hypothetical protein